MELIEHIVGAFAGAALGYLFARVVCGAID